LNVCLVDLAVWCFLCLYVSLLSVYSHVHIASKILLSYAWIDMAMSIFNSCIWICTIIIVGILIVVLSVLGIYFNIGLPNGLKGFLFYIQVVCVCVSVYVCLYAHAVHGWGPDGTLYSWSHCYPKAYLTTWY